jgi:hypothetical protein
MNLTLMLLMLAALVLAGEPAPGLPATYASYATTVSELAPATAARPARVIALHAFVRDAIAETPTKWG